MDWRRAVAAAVIVACGVGWWLTPNRIRKFSHDESCYVGLARALAAGQGYVFDGRPHTQYPPGYPAVLAPVVAVFGDAPPVIARVNVLLAVLGLLLTAGFFVRRSTAAALPLLALVALSPIVYRFATDEPMSEMLYLAASLGFIWWVERAPQPPIAGRARRFASAAVGIALLSLGILTRTIGIALVGACVAALLHERWRRLPGTPAVAGRKLVVPLIAATVVLAVWFVWSATAAHPLYRGEFMPPYTKQILQADPHYPDLGGASVLAMAARVPGMVVVQLAHIAELLTCLPWVAPLWFSPLAAVTALLVGLGWWREVRTAWPRSFGAWYLAAYGAILLVWPFDEGKRFLLPVVPLLFWVVWTGALELRRLLTTLDMQRGWWAFGAALVAAALAVAARMQDSSRQGLAAAGVWAGLAVLVLLARALRLNAMTLAKSVPLGLGLTVALNLGLGVRAILQNAAANRAANPDATPHVGARRASIWVARHSAPADVIMAGDYAAIHLATGRRTVRFPISGEVGRLRDALAIARPRFLVIIDPPPHPYYLPVEPERMALLERDEPGRFVLRGEFDGGRIYEVRYTGDGSAVTVTAPRSPVAAGPSGARPARPGLTAR